ncbi:HAD family phosphatase [Streptomyces sp. NPDC005012]|uniref:HAD family hydrolase n=1 Tax=unclassified Streptomyces TaxID=2593676 RepID=UPI0033A8B886
MKALMRKRPLAVVFDCDGTLLDTEQAWQTAREDVLAALGASSDSGLLAEVEGMHYAECGKRLAEHAGRPERGAESARKLLELYEHRVRAGVRAMPGAVDMVRMLNGRVPLAVASNCPDSTVRSSLNMVQIAACFAAVVAVGHGVAPKPAPDVYLRAAEQLGVAARDVVAVEDSGSGAGSAREAGMRVLLVNPDATDEDRRNADAWTPHLSSPEAMRWGAFVAGTRH